MVVGGRDDNFGNWKRRRGGRGVKNDAKKNA